MSYLPSSIFHLPSSLAVVLLGSALIHAAPSADANATEYKDLGVITVTPDRVSEPLRDSTANVTIIGAAEIEERGYQTVADAVSRISGFSFASNGGAGQSSGLFLRGFNSGNILILLDGVPLKDPTDPSFSAGLAHLRLDDVARIEVVKGAQSGIWGADAVAGVINIVTKSAAPGAHVSLRGGGGSYDTWQGGITLSADGEAGSFILSGDHYKTHSFSALRPRDAEADGYTNDTLHFKGTLHLSETSSMSLFYHQIDGDFDYDSGNPDDSLSHGNFSDRLGGMRWDYHSGALSLQAQASVNWIDREMVDASWGPSEYHGQATRATLHASYALDEAQLLSGGFDYNRYEGSSTFQPSSAYDNRGIYGSYRYIADDLLGARTIFNATLRYDDFSTFRNKTTYRFGFKRECHLLPGFFTAGNLYSAYKAPSLYQYATNQALKPESTEGFEFSAGYRELLKLTYFRNRVKDRIDYDFGTWSYFNSPQRYTLDGLEAEGRYAIEEIDTVLSANYTHMFSLSDDQGKPILRVPRNEANLFVDYSFSDTIHLGANLQYVGQRTDYGEIPLGSYTLVNLSYTQRIGENLKLSLQLHNLFDRDYETVHGYSTEGRSLYGKVEYRF
ncbi:TonB-dependent receptor plug domain-containing protein [Nitratifractor sp.]